MPSLQTFTYTKPFELESGAVLQEYHLGYHTFGKLSATKNNVVWIFHALTANSNPSEWWDGLVGDEKLFNANDYFIVCVNMPGSCYGSVNPLNIDVKTGEPFYHAFPFFTTRDMIRAYQPLKKHLGIDKIFIGIGGSMGGQQLIEWACQEPQLFENIIPIATNAFHSPWGKAFNATQRMAIENDSTWRLLKPTAGLNGMKTARAIALLSYRHYAAYYNSQFENDDAKIEGFKSESYQRYQGDKLVKRFNAFSYYKLTQSMDAHHIGRGRKSVIDALQKIESKALVLSISSDILFPPQEQQFIAENIKDAEYYTIDSSYGHDGFLIEYAAIKKHIVDFLDKQYVTINYKKVV